MPRKATTQMGYPQICDCGMKVPCMKEHFMHLYAVCPVLNEKLIGPVRLTIGPEPK